MKRMICLLSVILSLTFRGHAQEMFKIHGVFSKLKKDMKVMLTYHLEHRQIRDSTMTRNGVFDLKGNILIKRPLKATLGFKPSENSPDLSYIEQLLSIDEQDFFLENTEIQVLGSNKMNTAVITGGKTQSELRDLQSLKQEERKEMLELQEQMIPMLIESQGFGIDSNQKVQALSMKMQPLVRRMKEKDETFIKSHPDSYVTLDLLEQRSRMIKPSKFEPMLDGLSPKLRNSKAGREMRRRLNIDKQTAIGVKAIDFTLPDQDGKLSSLSSFKGKYVLLNFWMSRSEACRTENLSLLQAYLQFKDKGFEILSVSLDADQENWFSAVQEDHLIWPQLNDLRGWNNKAAQLYAVTSVPKNFLISPEGRITGKNLFGEELIEKLEEILK